jgi:hypothetical protein
MIYGRYKHRKGIGEKLLSFPIDKLKRLSQTVTERIRVSYPLAKLEKWDAIGIDLTSEM